MYPASKTGLDILKLFLAEKPTSGKAIANHLAGSKTIKDGYIKVGSDSAVTWCFGHIFEQEEPDHYTPDDVPRNRNGKKRWRWADLPIFPQTWDKRPRPSAQKQIKVIQYLLKKATVVVHAGDPDREGQLLVDEILEILGWKGPTERIWLSALDDISVPTALANLQDNSKLRPLRDAAEARSRADWLMGMNLTRAFTLQSTGRGVVSVGRVQTPTLAIVVARDEAIESFTPKDYLIPRIHTGFWSSWAPADDAPQVDPQGYLTDRPWAETLLQQVTEEGKAVVTAYASTDKSQPPPLGFSLSELQRICSAKFGMTASAVLKAAQALYEVHKATTYPRTDCRYLPEEQFGDAPRIFAGLEQQGFRGHLRLADAQRKSPIWNTAKVSSHHAIIPTGSLQGRLSEDARKIYQLVVLFYLAQFYPDYRFRSTEVTLQCAGESWKSSVNIPVDQGWKALFRSSGAENESKVPLPELAIGQELVVDQVELQQKTTKPPKRFTDGTLVHAMTNIHEFIEDEDAKKTLKQSAGLGTDATRASIIETLVTRQFLRRDGKAIVSTPAGRSLVHSLPPELVDPVMTAQWEDSLAQIANGGMTISQFELRQREFVSVLVDVAKGERSSAKGVVSAPKQEDSAQLAIENKAEESQQPQAIIPLEESGESCPHCQRPTQAYMREDRRLLYRCDACGLAWWPSSANPGWLGEKW